MNSHQNPALQPAVRRVADALEGLGLAPQIVEFADSTRTAEEAARAIGTAVGRIVKSLVFVRLSSGSAEPQPLLVLASGANRVDLATLGQALDAEVKRADATLVREVTGFAIGGVPPVGHLTDLPVVLDQDLLQYDLVYAAAGTPHTVFPITPHELLRITRARVLRVNG